MTTTSTRYVGYLIYGICALFWLTKLDTIKVLIGNHLYDNKSMNLNASPKQQPCSVQFNGKIVTSNGECTVDIVPFLLFEQHQHWECYLFVYSTKTTLLACLSSQLLKQRISQTAPILMCVLRLIASFKCAQMCQKNTRGDKGRRRKINVVRNWIIKRTKRWKPDGVTFM